jgi:phage terminase small subunit
MQPEDVILVEDYCLKYNIEHTFVFSLEEYGLIELVVVEEQKWIPIYQIQAIEKFSNLYYDLNINIDGIDAISHLLQKIETMQKRFGG